MSHLERDSETRKITLPVSDSLQQCASPFSYLSEKKVFFQHETLARLDLVTNHRSFDWEVEPSQSTVEFSRPFLEAETYGESHKEDFWSKNRPPMPLLNDYARPPAPSLNWFRVSQQLPMVVLNMNYPELKLRVVSLCLWKCSFYRSPHSLLNKSGDGELQRDL